ncbi:thioesterase II family protein [Streptomyces sp. TLI_185]|uniref:thioesterase II family protein n=1 Tax=Streptomyces sp. TLI_185 TaxID=2485151 RepID=UPI000F4DA526|nr:alpha/beta fold hydrolase [Streptomyces sp. TLI_185]RPF24843.1 surfactin synthase thioesterase subunit [Streptomyces sp. TLI_185]
MTTATVAPDTPWIRRYQHAEPGAAQLVCLPHAGGSAPFFLPVARGLAGRCEVLAIQYPGRHERLMEPLLDSVDELADQLFPVLRRQTRGPIALFGHSLGATVAFELARRFEASGTVPTALFVSARTAPSRQPATAVHLGTDAELIARMRSLGGTDEEILADEALLRLALPIVRNDYKAAETYRYRAGRPLSCPVHALIGRDDQGVTEDDARAWADHTTGSFALHTYSGGHFYLVDHQEEVLGAIAGQLLPA